MADDSRQEAAAAMLPQGEARLVEAVAARILKGLWPDLGWGAADEHVRALCRRAAQAAVLTVRLRNAAEGAAKDGAPPAAPGLRVTDGRSSSLPS